MTTKSRIQNLTLAAVLAALTLGMAACHKEGPAEKMGEKVDKTVNTIKNGGEETTADKLDDAGDKVKDAASDMTKKD
ncbi:MAG: hypothetical protein ABI885_11160 [Gammaproteobacteria bacterium]